MADSQTLFEQALVSEGITGERADLSRAIFGQESGGNVKSRTSNRGAIGGMQILQGTFNEVADKGWDISNPEHNVRAGIRYANKMYDRAGGDARLGAIGYYAGPGGQDAASKGEVRIDKVNPGAPNTEQYADQVLSKMSNFKEPFTYDPKAGELSRAIKSAQMAPASRVALVPSDAVFADAAKRSEDYAATDPTLPEMWGAVVAGATTSRLFNAADHLVNHVFRDNPLDVIDPNFAVPQAALDSARSTDEVQELFELKNQAQYDKYKSDKAAEQFRQQTVFSRGTATGMVMSFAGEIADPTNMLTMGLASIRAVGAAAKATAAGKAFNPITSAIVENVASGTAIEGTIQLMDQRADLTTLGISVIADTVLGAGGGYLAKRGIDAQQAVHRMATAKIEADAITMTKAQSNLGTGHTQEELVKEFDRVRVEELKATSVSAVTPSKPTEKLMPHPDEALDVPKVDVTPTATPLQGPDMPSITVRESLKDALGSPALQVVTETSRATRHLLTHLQNILPTHVLDNVSVKFEGNVRGVYNTADNTISAPGASASTLQPTARNDANILAHEVVHAATGRLIAAVRDKVPGVSSGLVEAVTRLEGIRIDLDKNLRSMGLRDATRKSGADYAAGDLDEFVAQVMSDVETRKALSQMPAKGFSNMLSAFADAVVRLLGLDPKTTNSALKEAVALVEKIIKEGEVPSGTTAATWIKAKPGLAPVASKVNDFLTNQDAIRFNLTGLPLASKSDRADAEAMLGLRLKAEAWGKANPKDAAWDARSKNLSNNDTLNVASTALTMLSSKDDLSRMLAHMLLEDASGVAGKRPMNSAALSKDTFHKLFLGNTTNDMQNSFAAWSKTRGGSFKDDYINGGQLRKKFDLEIAAEIEYRAIHKTSATKDPIVDAAVRSVHAAYERMRNAQIEHKTLGWAALPKEEVSYMPHSLMPGKVNALTPAQTDVLRSALTDQYVSISGWDISFSDQLSAAVVARVKARAVGGFETPLGGQNPGSAQIIEDALGMMNLDADTIRSKMKDFRKGAANFTKHRTSLDLNKEYPTPDGVFKLMDVYETDQLTLLRSQAGRVSGEVALAQQGIYGKPHMALLRKTLAQDAKTPQELKTLEAFDQIAAEFMHEPFGTVAHKNVERLRIMTSLLRLGGIVYSQFAEFINMAFHIGGGRTLSSISSVPRLRREVIDLAAGKKVDNPLLGSMETFAGEFGTDAYKIVLPFDSMDHAYPTYGRDTLTMFDRLLRGGSHVQAKLSGWRALHAAQHRGVAEQIVSKFSKYVKEGKESKALESMGFSPDLVARIKLDIDKVATFDGSGNLTAFDMTKFTDPEVATATWQAVKRGTSQIIQGTFIGETGKWAHNDYLKVLTQFRTFSITSMEKQWGRQRNSRGQWEAMGMVMAAMSLAVPIHVARTYANSVGRKDQDAYLEKNLKMERIVRASMNYVAGTGMFPDLFDMAVAAAPDGAIKKTTGFEISGITGGRPGADTTLMGTFAPAVGTAESVWKLLQNMDNIDAWEKMAPGNRHPFVVPLLNALGN